MIIKSGMTGRNNDLTNIIPFGKHYKLTLKARCEAGFYMVFSTTVRNDS